MLRPLVAVCLFAPAVALAADYAWSVPEQVEEVEIPGTMIANQVPVRVKAAVSKRSIYALQDYYLQEFKHAGLYVAPYWQQTHSTKYPELTGLDVDKLVAYTVILQPNQDGSTTVIMGTSDVSHYPNGPSPGDFAPLPPDATTVSRVHTEGVTMMLFTSKQSEKDVAAFYAKALGEAGYKPDAEGRYVRRDGWITVKTRTEKNKTYVSLEHGGSGAK